MCKIVNISDFRKKREAEHATVKCEPEQDQDQENMSFEEVAEMNRQNDLRVKRERDKANKAITRSLKKRKR